MSGFRRFEIIEHTSPFCFREEASSIFSSKTLTINPYFPNPLMEDFDEFSYALDILNLKHTPIPAALFDFPSRFSSVFDTVTDLVQMEMTPFCSSHRRLQHLRPVVASELYLQTLSERVSELESKFESLLKEKEEKKKKLKEVDRKYTWTAEIKDGLERKYKWVAEIKGERKEEKKAKNGGERSYKWIAEIGKDDEKRTYTWRATVGGDNGESSKVFKDKEEKEKKVKKKKKEERGSRGTRIVEIEEPSDHAAIALRQAFAKRAAAAIARGKRKELSPQDAAAMIQISFREYLIRRSRALRAFRELAVAKTKLKEIRAMFHNLSYRSRVAHDAEERQKFSEKIIVLLLTVDAIEGGDLMVRAAKRSMVDELEAMLDVVDPQPPAKSLSMRRRTFDMPSGAIQKEIAEGVAKVVEMLDEEEEEEDETSEA
ncbi:hypothetical protein Ancab_010277 [Ancistrocladus abbreviatus]